MDVEHFIETVRKYPCLWNTAAIEYRDQELKDAAWAEVMKETELSSETVQQYPCLWNTASIQYRDQELKDSAWVEVMKEAELSSVKEVKLKWKKLRDSYRDALKRAQDGGGGGGGGGRAAWKYAAAMAFLQPHMGARRKLPPAPPPASSDSSDDSSASPPPPPPPERLQKRPLEPYAPDPLDIFFNGMCQAAKRLPFAAQLKIKRTLFEAVTGAEEALLAEQHSLASLWASRAQDEDDDDRKPS